jgi:3-hydroxyisobutyrate dehydrogenase-like beta-hydroxyacid dehydrogenase
MSNWGFIGLGSQGAPMAQRMIDSGNPVVLWARREESLTPFRGGAARFADTVTELGNRVNYCGVCVVDDPGVESIVNELVEVMAPDSTIVIHSTITPELCRSLNAMAKSRGISLVDAPVSGGGGAAAEGELTVMVGASEEAFSKAKPVLETFARLITHLGDVGAGQLAKLVNNNLMAANLALAHHALAIAEELHIDRQAFIELVQASSGRSFGFDVRARMPEPKSFEHGAKLLQKDVRLLRECLASSEHYDTLSFAAKDFLRRALS